MSKAPPSLPDNSLLAVPAAAGGASQRVRELPPPPRVADRAAPPEPPPGPPRLAPRWRRWIDRPETASFLASFVLHTALILLLGLAFSIPEPITMHHGLLASWHVPDPLEDLLAVAESDVATKLELQGQADGVVPHMAPGRLELQNVADTSPGPSTSDPLPATRDGKAAVDLLRSSDADVTGGMLGRGRQSRPALAQYRGGSPESEKAVERGLRWLMAHQRPDGSWRFDHRGPTCNDYCRNPGNFGSSTASTAMALLPFLGAGYTHREGEYQDNVQRALYYLNQRAVATERGVDLQEGSMYAQGLSAIALGEAYGMTRDPALRQIAQKALDFIVAAQDKQGGGWRYVPGTPGDMTVSGWQVMALKSGQMAGLHVPRAAIYQFKTFLDSLQFDRGAQYYYLPGQKNTESTTAIGLLMRMYTGWGREHPALYRGVGLLEQWGPSDDNMYYNYYATQVLHHWEGGQWSQWNAKMRDYLVRTQSSQGHESGSWHFASDQSTSGGRLYNTAMAIMTLEVYYRYMPLYTPKAGGADF